MKRHIHTCAEWEHNHASCRVEEQQGICNAMHSCLSCCNNIHAICGRDVTIDEFEEHAPLGTPEEGAGGQRICSAYDRTDMLEESRSVAQIYKYDATDTAGEEPAYNRC